MKTSHYLLSTLLLLCSCNSFKNLADVSQKEILLQYSRSACFGTCPVYEVVLTHSGKAYFVGKRFVPAMDTIFFTVDSKIFRDINAIRNLESYQTLNTDESNVEVMDVPVLNFSDQENEINMELKMNIPGEIEAITDRIDRELTHRNLLPGKGENVLVQEEIIVETASDIDPYNFNKSFRFYELNYLDKISNNIYLFRIITTQKQIPDALSELNSTEGIIAAQKNHKLEHR